MQKWLTRYTAFYIIIGLTALFFLLVGFLLMILMRWQLAWPSQPLPAWLVPTSTKRVPAGAAGPACRASGPLIGVRRSSPVTEATKVLPSC